MAALLIIVFLLFLFLGVPIGISLGASGVISIVNSGISLDLLPMQVYSNISKFVLLAIPFFIFAGNVMEKAGISTRLIHFANTCVGHRRGGLATVAVIVCCFFAAVSGSGPATVAALGVILIPAMFEKGYGKAMPSALLATAGSIGIIIPPSIPFVVYGSISGASIGKLFMAGIIPGILMGVMLALASKLVIRGDNSIILMPKATGKERWKAFIDAFWGLLMPVIILGGIYGGIFTPTEAAAVAAVYGLLVGLFIYRTIKLKDLLQILIDSAKTTASVMIVIACAALFAWYMQISGISQSISNMLYTSTHTKFLFLLTINFILLIAGCLLDTTSAMYILVPIILPVARMFNCDDIALGVLVTMNLAIGLATPPVGCTLFVACGVSGIKLSEISKAVIPFIIASLIALLLVTYFPQLYMWLPKLMGY